jgi:hypothetical protein
MLDHGIYTVDLANRIKLRAGLKKDRFALNNIVSSLKKRGVLTGQKGLLGLNKDLLDAISSESFTLRISKN